MSGVFVDWLLYVFIFHHGKPQLSMVQQDTCWHLCQCVFILILAHLFLFVIWEMP